MNISDLRRRYHEKISAQIIRISRRAGKEDFPNFADGDSAVSRQLAWGIVDRENPVIFYKEGTWSRPIKGGLWEMGCDLRYWLLSGELAYVDFIKGINELKAGEPFARIYSSAGHSHELLSPMSAGIREVNVKANDVMTALLKEHLSEGWLLWLARVFPKGTD